MQYKVQRISCVVHVDAEKGMVPPMAFTQDELQSLNTILEQKLSAQRHDLERTFDLRLQALRRDFEQRVATVKSDLLQTMSQRLNDQHARTREILSQKFETQHAQLIESVAQSFEEQQQRLEASIERPLAAQLLAIEQIIRQRLSSSIQSAELFPEYTVEGQAQFDTIEVQTEIPWDELATLVDHALEERMSALQDSILTALKDLEQALLTRTQSTGTSSAPDAAAQSSTDTQPASDSAKNIERLEHLIEAMQVAMTANSSLISNRLYHHQQLPLERAHPTQHNSSPPTPLHSLKYPHARSSSSEPASKDE